MADYLISLINIDKYAGFDDSANHILKNISLNIERGEFIAITGHSGSGKSTLLNILGCLDLPTSGTYFFDGIPITDLSIDQLSFIRNTLFGFIFQKYNLLNNLSALENVALPSIYLGIASSRRKERALKLLEHLGLKDKYTNLPTELSGGQQQRVSIARALMNGGEIVFADEPTGALDTQNGNLVISILKELHKQGHTIILVTHNPEIAAQATRTIEIQDGEIISNIRNFNIKTQKQTANINIKQKSTSKNIDLFLESFKMATSSILYHKMRSLLTMLGIIIGIAAVVSVLALGRSSQKKILDDIREIGTNTVEIFPGKDFGDLEAWRVKTLNVYDSYSLAQLNFVTGASPKISEQGVLTWNNISLNCIVNGVGDQFFQVKGLKNSLGNFFSKKNIDSIESLVVLDCNAKKILFGDEASPINEIIFLNKQPLRVIGVIKSNSYSNNIANNPNIYIPYTTMIYKISGLRNIDSIILKINDNINAQAAEKGITNFLISRHNGVKDFYTFNSDNIKLAVEKTTNTMTILISSIALTALIVGGIGVMNIMLVSVSERTSEIGLRMAIGARQKDLLTQFLIEAVIICLLGGLMGILTSIILIPIINFFITDFVISYTIDSFLLALACSTIVGVLFGYIPAKNASKLNPKEALGRE